MRSSSAAAFSGETIAASIAALTQGGRLVAHAVTLESEALLLAATRRAPGRADAPLHIARRAARRFLRVAAGDASDAMGMAKAMSGHLYGIGVGPGDPELMTLKAARLVTTAPGHRLARTERR